LLAALMALTAMALLHSVQASLDPFEEPVSFYVHGKHGGLLTLSLCTFGFAVFGLSRVLNSALPNRSRRALMLVGLGMGVMAVLPSDLWFPWEQKPGASGLIHSAVAMITPIFLLDPMIASTRKHYRYAGHTIRWLVALYGLSLIGSGVSLTIGFAGGRAPPLIGVAERVLALSALLWVALSAWQARQPSS
jgi:hypothetical protein